MSMTYLHFSCILLKPYLIQAAGAPGTQTTRHGRTATKVTPGSNKPKSSKSKTNGRRDSNPTKSVPQPVDP